MANKLKIYACSGLSRQAKAKITSGYNYWTDNTNVVSNTQAVNTLLTLINEKYIEVSYLKKISNEQIISNLNSIDLYTICLYYAQKYSDDPKQLHHAGEVISSLFQNGYFSYESLDNKERDKHLDELLVIAESAMNNRELGELNEGILYWWEVNIEKRNIIGLSTSEQQTIESVSGVGNSDWQGDDNISNYLLKGGEYFLYTYFTEEQIANLPRIFKAKKKLQQKTYDYCKGLFTKMYGSEDEMKRIIRSSIIGYFGVEPEEICAGIYKDQSKHKGIGDLVILGMAAEKFFEILVSILSIVGAIIYAICECVAKTNQAKYAAVNKATVESSTPAPEDYEGYNFDEMLGSSSSKSWLTIVALAIGAFLLIKK